jgi:hypothetical protein
VGDFVEGHCKPLALIWVGLKGSKLGVQKLGLSGRRRSELPYVDVDICSRLLKYTKNGLAAWWRKQLFGKGASATQMDNVHVGGNARSSVACIRALFLLFDDVVAVSVFLSISS